MGKTISKIINVNNSNSTFTLAATKTVVIEPDPGQFISAIQESTSAKNNKIVIKGDIILPNGTNGAIAAEGFSTDVIIDKTAEIHTGFGVMARGVNTKVINNGDINASAYGFTATSTGAVMTNNASIDASTGVRIENAPNKMINGKHGLIYASNNGIEVAIQAANYDALDVGTVTIINKGTVSGSYTSINAVNNNGGEHAHVRITNSGHLYGDVRLGGGDDTFDSRKGTLFGEAYGGVGDDVYKVKNAKTIIIEYSGEGEDTVQSMSSYVLGDNFENLTLLEKAAKATGNGLDNILTGNNIANTLEGLDGNDTLNGGTGNDMLTGGMGMDTFKFTTGFDKDKITDFEDAMDKIWLSGLKKINDFGDVENRIKQHGADTVITITKDDTITIQNFDAANLTADDFYWPV